MAPLGALLALAALAANRAAAQSGSTFRTADDDKALQDANKARSEDCAAVDLTGIDAEKERKRLKSLMGSDENIILKVFKEANGPGELTKKVEENITVEWLIWTAGSLVFSLVLVFIWLICCWSACPCCKCCLCCRKQRKVGKVVKFVALAAMAALIFGMVVSAMAALAGRGDIEDGMNSVSCTSAKTMYHTLDGKTSQNFIGVLPMLDQLATIRAGLLDNSAFINQVQRIMRDTAELEESQFVAVQSLQLLEDTLRLPANQRPPMTQAIQQLIQAVEAVKTAVNSGLAQAMNNARDTVDDQLSSANRATLRSAVDAAVTPLREAANSVRDAMWFFIKEDFRNIKDKAVEVSSGGIIGIACAIFLLGACGLCSGLCCAFNDREDRLEKHGENPWNTHVTLFSLSTWCFGCFYGFLVFFFGGIMIVCAVPMSSGCLIMDEINSNMITDILPALGTNATGDGFGMVTDIIDGCFSRTAASASSSLMELVYFTENGNKVTLKQKLDTQLVGQVDSQFDAINQMLGQSSTIADNSDVVRLKNELAGFTWPPAVPHDPAPSFRCDLFRENSGLDCDVLNMRKVGGNWISDCVVSTSPLTTRSKTRSCNSQQFETYLNDWATRMDNVLRRVDGSVAAAGTKISHELQTAVDGIVTYPVRNITTQADCTFLRQEFQDFVSGFCFRGVTGFGSVARAYVANGVLTIMMIILTYFIWRIMLDNRFAWDRDVREIKQGEQVGDQSPQAWNDEVKVVRAEELA